MADNVNHPAHYQSKSGLETIQIIEACVEDLDGMEAVCTANIIKYISRWKKKNGLEDLKKAQWYLNRLIHDIENIERVPIESVEEKVRDSHYHNFIFLKR